ncbi:hypothetical protein AB0A05_07670 [Streptomyces sp. NPDC046374]|uniref:hypothetical protein n=1 Tax=Streptomyces sp. NPDC046374 TaxID=3154917 RepID=UPI0033F5D913
MTAEEIAAALDVADETMPGASAPGVGRPPTRASWEEAFRQRTVAVEGGHLSWTGPTTRRTPVVAHRGQVETAYRLAFRWHHGREPQGNVRPTCDYPGCVAGGHLADRVIREGGAP